MSEIGDSSASAATSPEALNPDSPSEPIRLIDLVSLYTRPRRFFSRGRNLGARMYLLPTIWLIGISAQVDRIETEILRFQLGQSRQAWQIIEPLVTGSWLWFWAFSLAGGIVSGALLYFIAGWWYGVRVRFSGAKDFDKHRARHLYAWSSFIVACPYVLLTVASTAMHPNYLAASNSEELIGYVFLALIFWSIGVSYVGVSSSFEMVRWRAIIWFLALPVLFYLFSLGLVVGLMAYFT